jgi:ubiquinone/menaquinone biosynthesis C-methylase UbiE
VKTSNIHKEWVAGVFDRASDSYDRTGPKFFTYFGKGLVEYSEIQSGSQILDVACGSGAVLIPASEIVGKHGSVIGIDISKGMISRLEDVLEQKRILNVKVDLMDAEDLKFPDVTFDAVLCGFALFFFPDLTRALDEFNRVLKPQGCIYVSTIARIETPWEDSLLEIRKSYQDRLAPVPAMKTKDLNQEKEVTEVLDAVGFENIEHQIDTKQLSFRDEVEWWETQWSIFHRAFMERLDPDSLREYQREVLDIVRESKSDKGIATTIFARYSSAKKPPIG